MIKCVKILRGPPHLTGTAMRLPSGQGSPFPVRIRRRVLPVRAHRPRRSPTPISVQAPRSHLPSSTPCLARSRSRGHRDGPDYGSGRRRCLPFPK